MRCSMTPKNLIRASILTFAAVVLLSAPGPQTESEARFTRCGTKATFYSDATLTTVVGFQAYAPQSCGCRLTQYGTQSLFRVIEEHPYCY